MHRSLNMCFLVNPKRDQVRLNEHMKLWVKKNHDSKHEQWVQTEPGCSKRKRVEKSFGPDFLTYLLENEP